MEDTTLHMPKTETNGMILTIVLADRSRENPSKEVVPTYYFTRGGTNDRMTYKSSYEYYNIDNIDVNKELKSKQLLVFN